MHRPGAGPPLTALGPVSGPTFRLLTIKQSPDLSEGGVAG